jgi:hypothetical protein
LSILGRKDAAFAHLDDAVNLGFANTGQLTQDPALSNLRGDPRFQALLQETQGKTVVAAK